MTWDALKLRRIFVLALLAASSALAATDAVADVYDAQVKAKEREILRLAPSLPAYSTRIYTISASILPEKPVDTGKTGNGPDTLVSKDRMIKGALTYAHRAAGSLTQKNLLDPVPSPFGRGTMQRMAAAWCDPRRSGFAVSHL
jgi:hypothetical protein